MLSYFQMKRGRTPFFCSKEPLLPHRAPGSPGHSAEIVPFGQADRNYRPQGSAEIRHLIDDGFQAFNAGRLSEACTIFADKMLAPEPTTRRSA